MPRATTYQPYDPAQLREASGRCGRTRVPLHWHCSKQPRSMNTLTYTPPPSGPRSCSSPLPSECPVVTRPALPFSTLSSPYLYAPLPAPPAALHRPRVLRCRELHHHPHGGKCTRERGWAVQPVRHGVVRRAALCGELHHYPHGGKCTRNLEGAGDLFCAWVTRNEALGGEEVGLQADVAAAAAAAEAAAQPLRTRAAGAYGGLRAVL